MKTSKKKISATTKYLLTNYNGTEIHLSVPNKTSNEQKHYLEYTNDGRKKDYAKGEIKRKYQAFTKELENRQRLTNPQLIAELASIFNLEIEFIQHQLSLTEKPAEVSLKTKVHDAFKEFFSYKELQKNEGTVNRISLYGYKHHSKKLTLYFNLPNFKCLTLQDLSASIWLNYRVDLLNNTYQLSKGKLKNSSVNQHFLYIHQFYSWLIDYNDFPIKNHLKKLNKLSESQQDKRFKVIPDSLLQEFYSILETYEKYYFTRLYLSALFLYENNIRLSEQVLIKVGDINLLEDSIRIVNNKNDKVRTVKISSKAKELIGIIEANTIKSGAEINDNMYLIGGYDMFKSGIPHGQKELGIVMRRFRKKYPQFAGRTLYEHKHTSITNQFNNGVDPYQIKERANHGSISTTEIYLQSSKTILPFELNLRE